MNSRHFALTILSALGLSIASAQSPITSVADIQRCLDDQAPYVGSPVCSLAAMTFDLSSPLWMRKSNKTLQGAGRSATVLRRSASSPSLQWMLIADFGISGLKVRDLTVDGNRFNISSIKCLSGNPPYWDVDFSRAGSAVTNEISADFKNAPGTSIQIGGRTALSYSNIDNARATGLWIGGQDSGIWYSHLTYNGTAAVTATGTTPYVYGNFIYSNRYEQPDNYSGGQLTIWEGTVNARIAANTIDGANWMTTAFVGPGNCPATVGDMSGGIEGYGSGLYIGNNEIRYHLGTGIQLGGSEVTGPVTISGYNVFDPQDVPRYVWGNGNKGIWTVNDRPTYLPVTGLTLDHVRVIQNGNYQVDVGNATGTGFINNACINGSMLISTTGASLTYPAPGSMSVCP